MNLSVCCANKNRSPCSNFPSIHQISTLEKTQLYQHSILSSLMSKRLEQVAPVLWCLLQFANSEEIDFHVWFSLGFLLQVEGSTSRVLSLNRETKFIIGFDFAVTLSSPGSFCVLFRHHFRTFCRTGMANVKQTQKMISIHHVWSFPWSVCLRFGFLVSMYLILDFWGSKLIRSNNQSKATLWVLENTSMIVLITASFFFKLTQPSFLMRRLDVWGNKNIII